MSINSVQFLDINGYIYEIQKELLGATGPSQTLKEILAVFYVKHVAYESLAFCAHDTSFNRNSKFE